MKQQHNEHGVLTTVRGGPYHGQDLSIGVEGVSAPFHCVSNGTYFNGQYLKGIWKFTVEKKRGNKNG